MVTPDSVAGDSRPADASDALTSNVWVELIAFDTAAADLGVGAYLADLGQQPRQLSLLLYSLEFLHSHVPGDDAAPLPVECTSYGARPWSARGPRQNWTQGDLRRLVELLTTAGTKVHFALFDLCGFELEGQRRISRFSEDRPELTVIDARGLRRDGMINPLRALADGTPYTTAILAGVREVMADYAFSGWHVADGLSSTRLALWDGDFGSSYVQLFAADHPGLVDPDLLTGDAPEQVAARAEAVWRDGRIEWIRYHAERWATFWTQASALMAEFGASVIMNNAWTRDPFEALYRFGADYSRVEPAGITSLVVESPAAAVELLNRPACPPLDGIVAGTMLTRAHVSDLMALVGVHDVYEGWDIISHAPAMLQRDIWALTATRIATPAGFRRCLDGVLWCLADGVRAEQWQWLGEQVRRSGPGVITDEPAVTLLYDPAILWAEIEQFGSGRAATTQRWLTLLLRAGADLCRIATIDTPLPDDTPVVLLRSDLYTDAQCEAVRQHRHHALVSWESDGRWQVTLSDPDGDDRTVDHAATDPGAESGDNASWIVELPMAEPVPTAVDIVARWVNRWSLVGDATIATATRHRTTEWDEVTLVNREHAYVSTILDGPATDVTVVTHDSCVTRRTSDGTSIQLPPLGAATVRVRRSVSP